MTQQNEIRAWLEARREGIVDIWRELVDTPSHVSRRAEGDVLCRKLAELFASLGMEVSVIESGENNAPTVSALWGGDLPGAPVLFSGHYDTVDLQGDHPFRTDEQGHIRGLGCLDMKGGIAVSILVLEALKALGWQDRPVKFLFVGDEETGHQGGCAAETIRREAAGCLCAFNMETGLISDKICVGRKGTAFAAVKAHGVAAHSGNDFSSGRNAIAEIAAKIPRIQALTNLDEGTSVSCNTISGGTVVNGIPGECVLRIDSRYLKLAERERVFAALREITDEVAIEGCRSTLEVDERMPPFETSAGTLRLADFLSATAVSLGRAPMGQIVLGGGSDAAHISAAGVPVVCSMGVRGQFNHTANEYALPDSLLDRAELLIHTLLNSDELEQALLK